MEPKNENGFEYSPEENAAGTESATESGRERPTKKQRKKGRGWIVVLAVLVVLGGVFVFVNSRYAFFGGKLIARNVTELDLRGRSMSEEAYAKAEKLFPAAVIRRDVVIGGQAYDIDAPDIVTGDFTAEEIASFRLFRNLSTVDASACSDLNAVAALRDALPGVNVFYTVPVAGKTVPGDSEELTVDTVSAEELMTALSRLPEVKKVSVTADCLTPEEQKTILSAYPEVTFEWNVTVCGISFASTEEVADFTSRQLSEAELAALGTQLELLPDLTAVDLTDCGLSEEALKAFADAHPEVAVNWKTELFGVQFSTLDEEISFDNIPLTVEDAAQIEAMLPYMPRLQKVLMCDCGISDEDMDALNRRHEGVRFVWMVQLNSYGIRTDRTYFCVWNADKEYNFSNNTFEALKYCPDMEALDLGHQKLYGDAGTTFLSSLTNLKYLTLCDCQYTKVPELADLKNLVFLEMYWTNMDDITPLKELKNLKALNIVIKRVRDVENDLDVLCSMTWLEKLYISYNMYSLEQIQQIRDALPNTQIEIIETNNCCSHGWRSDNKYYYDYRDALHMYYISDESNQIFVNPFTGERSLYEDTNPFPFSG